LTWPSGIVPLLDPVQFEEDRLASRARLLGDIATKSKDANDAAARASAAATTAHGSFEVYKKAKEKSKTNDPMQKAGFADELAKAEAKEKVDRQNADQATAQAKTLETELLNLLEELRRLDR
jgi:hypothetical protein